MGVFFWPNAEIGASAGWTGPGNRQSGAAAQAQTKFNVKSRRAKELWLTLLACYSSAVMKIRSKSKTKRAIPVVAFFGENNQSSLTLPISLSFAEVCKRLRKMFPKIKRAEINDQTYLFTARSVKLVPTVEDLS